MVLKKKQTKKRSKELM